MSNESQSTRGGARKGAGRPRLDGTQARAIVSLRVAPENAERLRKMKAAGIVCRMFANPQKILHFFRKMFASIK